MSQACPVRKPKVGMEFVVGRRGKAKVECYFISLSFSIFYVILSADLILVATEPVDFINLKDAHYLQS